MKFLILLAFIALNSFAADCFYNVKSVSPEWKGNIKQKFEFLVNGKSEIVYKDRKTKIVGVAQAVNTSKFYCDCGEPQKCITQIRDYVKKIACKTPPKGRLNVGIVDSSGWDVDTINIKEDAVAPKVTNVLAVIEPIKENVAGDASSLDVSCTM